MRERFVVLWRRRTGATCPYRTADTGLTLSELLQELVPVLEENGVTVEVHVEETEGEGDVLFNSVPLDDLLAEAVGAERYCAGPSRMEELGNPALAFDPNAPVGRVLPEIVFRKAVLLALEE
ncbi:DUF2703 domain-containing protein [Methanofollis ethanolicus]|uniref:DUF2703 domain-containing protein n=1 Tax=Methanofollis ethanolicus TaxID=488124 RepID=UPI0008341DA8|nr:DUF2703 domain-containing protein [Methanofollis ethanolicus]